MRPSASFGCSRASNYERHRARVSDRLRWRSCVRRSRSVSPPLTGLGSITGLAGPARSAGGLLTGTTQISFGCPGPVREGIPSCNPGARSGTPLLGRSRPSRRQPSPRHSPFRPLRRAGSLRFAPSRRPLHRDPAPATAAAHVRWAAPDRPDTRRSDFSPRRPRPPCPVGPKAARQPTRATELATSSSVPRGRSCRRSSVAHRGSWDHPLRT